MPRFRFTVRRMMVAVAIAGALLGGGIGVARISPLAQSYRRAANSWAMRENGQAQMIPLEEDIADRWAAEVAKKDVEFASETDAKNRQLIGLWRDSYSDSLAKSRENLASRYRWRAYSAALRAKYEHAARYPWLPVAPDPPEPE